MLQLKLSVIFILVITAIAPTLSLPVAGHVGSGRFNFLPSTSQTKNALPQVLPKSQRTGSQSPVSRQSSSGQASISSVSAANSHEHHNQGTGSESPVSHHGSSRQASIGSVSSHELKNPVLYKALPPLPPESRTGSNSHVSPERQASTGSTVSAGVLHDSDHHNSPPSSPVVSSGSGSPSVSSSHDRHILPPVVSSGSGSPSVSSSHDRHILPPIEGGGPFIDDHMATLMKGHGNGS